jgi:oligopeptidase B
MEQVPCSMSPGFNNKAISLVNRGFVYAIAHIRGGDDMGHEWHESAKCLSKNNTFEDFIASAQTLIDQKYTSNGLIVIVGGSAGGMLVGNVINEQPDLFKAAIAHVPFVDVLNTMLDESLPLTPGEFKEWGNPKEKKYFDYIRSYSPYDNIKHQNYPHLMVTASITDPRVGYWEPAKWVAKLRDKKTDNHLIVLKTNMSAGHSGASSRTDHIAEHADDIVFILYVFGLVDNKTLKDQRRSLGRNHTTTRR